jgi:uncharacterized protein DUF6265
MRAMHTIWAAAALALGGGAGAAPAGRTEVAALAWLSGSWATEGEGSGGRWTEERWTPPRGGMMLGTGLSGGDKADNFEFMRIAADAEGVISFWGSPNGQKPVPFRLVSASAGEAVFENPEHDFPTRIAYRRSGNVLTATVSGPGGSGEQSWRYTLR